MNAIWIVIRINWISRVIGVLLFGLAMNPAFAADSDQNSAPGEALLKADLPAEALAKADLPAKALAKADALYAAKQYTQAFEFYRALEQDGHFTPAMLLKMAHIQEGLNHLGESLYYLNLYYLASDDAQALKKMEELATKNNLVGYETDESTHLLAWLQGQYINIAWALASTGVFLLALTWFLRTRKKLNPALAGIALVVVMSLLFADVNFNKAPDRGIVALPQTYLMSGPSAGASVVAIIGEGHQLAISGKKDIWLKVSWKEQEVYVRENLVRVVRL